MSQEMMRQKVMSLFPAGDEGMESVRGYKIWRGVPLAFINGETLLDNLENIKFRDDDIIIFTYPKCGTTFIGDMTHDLFVALGKITSDYKPVYPLEMGADSDHISEAPEDIQRVIVTHLPWDVMPEQLKQGKHKMMCVTRNPKDVFCSMYPFFKRMRIVNENMPKDKFLELYTSNKVAYGDYFDWHKQWLAHRDDPNVLTLAFEDMKADLGSSVRKIVEHLNFNLTEDEIQQVTQKNQFDAKKAAAKPGMEAQHLRKGKAGGWREELTDEEIDRLDNWIAEGKTKVEGFDLRC